MIRFASYLGGALVVASSSLVSAAQTRGSFERTLTVSGRVELDVWTGSGSITVRTGGDGTVEIRGEIKGRGSEVDAVRHYSANPPIEQDGNVVTVGRILEEDRRRHVKISYELVVPVDTELTSRTGSGGQKVGAIAGPVKIASGSGSLEIGRIGAEVDASTGSGSIEIDGVAGDLIVETGSGSIRAKDVAGAISAKSGSGTVDLVQTGSGNVAVETGSGRIRVAGVRGGLRAHTRSGNIDARGDIVGEWDLQASSGSIHVELPDESGYELDAETNSGRIDLRHPVSSSGRISNTKLRGSVRGGGPRLAVSTSSGSIRIR